MPHQGQLIIDQETGDTVQFIETAQDTNGQRVSIKVMQKSRGRLLDDHIHPNQEERFKVESGRMTYYINGEKKYLLAGQEITLPKDIPHNHYNSEEEALTYVQTIYPAYDIDYFIESFAGMKKDGRIKNGKLPFLQGMVTIKYLDSKTYLANMPRALQRSLANILGPIARWMGYRAIYKKYTGLDK